MFALTFLLANLWSVASESPDYQLHQLGGDTLEIVAPKGLTLWYNEKMSGNVVIEYDACLMLEEGHPEDRLSDLNCFWMASVPAQFSNLPAKTSTQSAKLSNLPSTKPQSVPGRFLDSYRMQLYYMGYGGNSNKTTRFRRYTGDAEGVENPSHRPAILVEYTDDAHLNVANQWRHIRLTSIVNGHVTYEIDGEKLVDFRDPEPLTEGYFGFRTTWSRSRIANFTYSCQAPYDETSIPLTWVGARDLSKACASGASYVGANDASKTSANDESSVSSSDAETDFSVPVSFGVPFEKGALTSVPSFSLNDSQGHSYPVDFTPLAYHLDGSIKWGGFTSAVPANVQGWTLTQQKAQKNKKVKKQSLAHSVSYPDVPYFTVLMTYVDGKSDLLAIDTTYVEREGAHHRITCYRGHCGASQHILRLTQTAQSPVCQLTHTFVNTRPDDAAMIRSMEIVFDVPLNERLYNRHVAFLTDSVWHEPIQPLTGRRQLPDHLYRKQLAGQRIPEVDQLDAKSQSLIADWATWNRYRLSQLNDMSYTIRKSAKQETPWIGYLAGNRAPGVAFVGDVSGGLMVALHDFWQSYPSTLLVEGATSDTARLHVQLWSADAEPMDLRHYDTEAHGLEAAYEDIQEGMSTPFGIARTSTLSFMLTDGYPGNDSFAKMAKTLAAEHQLLPSAEYLYAHRAFGTWSLPTDHDSIEHHLAALCEFYRQEQDRRHWYGFWNYGDFMHAYDEEKGEWRYDVGGFAWDNTELATNAALWYQFLRTGDADLWRMAVAMTRHTSEVDVYHAGPWNGLGSRHNVTHWGCGAKEARISQSFWNRFYYYLSGGDLRLGELMSAQRDVDTLLYRLDPMRLAQPRSEKFPCTAPARLRIGPDWFAYAGNWFTEWERTQDPRYLEKIFTGMRSINALPHGMFSGPKALGYDPATGVISWEGDPEYHNGAHHLATLMGGFEFLNEMLYELDAPDAKQFAQTYYDYCLNYKAETTKGKKGFPMARLHVYAAAHCLNDPALQQTKKEDFWLDFNDSRPVPPTNISTNSFATYLLDAIYMLEMMW